MSEPLDSILADIRQLANTGQVTPEGFPKLVKAVTEDIEKWKQSKLDKLQQMVSEWETSMGDEDKTFYTLGLRRAMDIISDEPALNQLPILETPDTPDAVQP